MNGIIDLHTHTNISDGTMTPMELMDEAIKTGLKIIALTDHDTVSGIDMALSHPKVSEYIPIFNGGDGFGNLKDPDTYSNPALKLIPGIEISTTWKEKDIHILGFYINRKDPDLLKSLETIQKRRSERNRKMIALMNADGIPLKEEDIPCSLSCVTRAHFAWFLTKLGISKDREDAFKHYIGNGCKYYLAKVPTSPVEAIEIIKAAGGIPFMAHPMIAKLSDKELDELVGILSEHGLKGLEAYHSSHNHSDVRKALALAEKYGLDISTGSDYHADNKPDVFLGMGRGNICCNELPSILM